MDVSDASYYIQENKGSRMGHTKTNISKIKLPEITSNGFRSMKQAMFE
jgi:hypothetical protein